MVIKLITKEKKNNYFSQNEIIKHFEAIETSEKIRLFYFCFPININISLVFEECVRIGLIYHCGS